MLAGVLPAKGAMAEIKNVDADAKAGSAAVSAGTFEQNHSVQSWYGRSHGEGSPDPNFLKIRCEEPNRIGVNDCRCAPSEGCDGEAGETAAYRRDAGSVVV